MDTKETAWVFAQENPDNIDHAVPRRYKREPSFISSMGTDQQKLIDKFGEKKYLKMLEDDKITGAEKDAMNERIIKDL